MDKSLARTICDAYKALKVDDDRRSIDDIIDEAASSDDRMICGQWCYLLGVADTLDMTIPQVVEEAQATK